MTAATTIEPDLFKQAMRKLCGSVTIVTSRNGDEICGLTATAVCSLSAEPPRLLACINRDGATYRAIARSRVFCVNVLAADHGDLASCFAGRLPLGSGSRFDHGEWLSLHSGAPALHQALAAFDCRVSSILDTGSHAVIIGDVTAIEIATTEQPLLYMNGQFGTIAV